MSLLSISDLQPGLKTRRYVRQAWRPALHRLFAEAGLGGLRYTGLSLRQAWGPALRRLFAEAGLKACATDRSSMRQASRPALRACATRCTAATSRRTELAP